MELPEYLELDAGGEIRLKGHRIRLIDVAARYEEGFAPEGIVLHHYPSLSLPMVHRVIAFYLENEPEVRRMMDANAMEMKRLEQALPRTTPSFEELRRRMAARRQAEAS